MDGPTNLFADIPGDLPEELSHTLLGTPGLRIERTVSLGHSSPEGFWYDQEAPMGAADEGRVRVPGRGLAPDEEVAVSASRSRGRPGGRIGAGGDAAAPQVSSLR